MAWKYDLILYTSINLFDYREAYLTDLRFLHGKLVSDMQKVLKDEERK
jgi:hypothetical protein